MKVMNYLTVAILTVMSGHAAASSELDGLTVLSDTELAAETGQSLFNLSYIAPNDAANLMKNKTINGTPVGNVGFYKLGLEGELELNANIKNLQLGCGGVNGVGACDIDIKNLSLSGLPNGGDYDNLGVATPNGGYDANGNPVYVNGRPSTSAKLVNPFVEFAIKNPDTASTREVIGFRSSAEKIYGLLTAGLTNGATASTTDGIQSLSGFMRIAATSGTVTTKETLFGNTADQVLTGVKRDSNGNLLGDEQAPMMIVSLLGNHKRIFTSQPGSPDNEGITVPSMQNVAFNTPNFRVNGTRSSAAVVSGIKLKVDEIPMGKVAVYDSQGNITGYTSAGAKNQLYVTYNKILGLADHAKFQMDDGSKVTNLNLDVTFSQSLSMFHNIPLNGNGGYLSLQSQKILWPGAYIKPAGSDYSGDMVNDTTKTELNDMSNSDVAQPGWWMSFADPVSLGKLKASAPVDISAALPQVAYLTSQYLQDNPIPISGSEGLQALFNTPIAKKLVIDLQTYTTANPVKTTLQNLQLINQSIVPNCYGGLTFC